MICTDPLAEARQALCAGDDARVLALLTDAWPHAHDDARRAWVLLAAEAGHLSVARELVQQMPEPERARLLELLADDPAPPDEEDTAFVVDPGVLHRRTASDAREIELFLRWFAGRRDLYAKAWYDERRRRAGYHPVQQPLTEQVARGHLQGAATIGQYLLHPDGACSFAVIDLDVSGKVMEGLRAAHGDAVTALEHAPLREAARRLLEAGRRLGLPLFAEDSGGRGVHLWLFVEPRRPARALRSALSQIVQGAGPIPPEVGLELYPKQDQLGPRGLSSLVKLPLGVHPATLRRCALLDAELRPIDDALSALERIAAAPVDAIDAVVGRRVVVLPAPELERCETVPRLVEQPTARSLAEVLRGIDAGEASRGACERVLRGCPRIDALARKAYESHSLEAPEARALVYTLGLIGPGPGMIDELLAAARFPRRELERVRTGLPSPMGCAKLKTMAADAAACSCFEKATALPYATPVLHAVGPVEPADPLWKPFASHLQSDGAVLANPLEQIGESLSRIERRLDDLEKKKEER